jgi:molybdenum cofactor biosynthesis protein B
MADKIKGEGIRVITATVSDRRKRVLDEVGKAIDQELSRAGFRIIRHSIISEEPDFIQRLVTEVANGNQADAVVMSGGTGINPRDQTFEALDAVFEKRIVGFGEALRRIAFDEVGPNVILSRPCAGVFNKCVVYSLPGSMRTALLGVTRLVIPTLEHAVELANERRTHTSAFPPPAR